MAVDPDLVEQIRANTLFLPEVVEQVLNLKLLLKKISEDPELSQHYVLIGGTAINLFDKNLPRLSVDLDLDFDQGSTSFEPSLIEHDRAILTRIAASLDMDPFEKQRLTERGAEKLRLIFEYRANFARETGQVKFDISYLQKTMVYDPVQLSMPMLSEDDPFEGLKFRIAHPCELWAGKAVAVIYKATDDPRPWDVSDLYSTQLARHLFDVSRIERLIRSQDSDLDMNSLRKAFILKAVPRVKNLHLLSGDGVRHCRDHEIETELDPYLRQGDNNDIKPQRPTLDEMKESSKDFLHRICSNVWTDQEKEFVRSFQRSGQYMPHLLFENGSKEYCRVSSSKYLRRCAEDYRENK
jgi:hypothetical protein